MPKLPGINHKRAVKAFEKSGFWVARKRKHFPIIIEQDADDVFIVTAMTFKHLIRKIQK